MDETTNGGEMAMDENKSGEVVISDPVDGGPLQLRGVPEFWWNVVDKRTGETRVITYGLYGGSPGMWCVGDTWLGTLDEAIETARAMLQRGYERMVEETERASRWASASAFPAVEPPAPEPRPASALRVEMLGTEAERASGTFTAWRVQRGDRSTAIVYAHEANTVLREVNGAPFVVCCPNFGAPTKVHSMDFGDVLRVASALLGGAQ